LDLVEENSLPRAPRPSPHPHVIGVSGPYPADLVEITSLGVQKAKIGVDGDRYRHAYTGLRLLTAGNGKTVLLPVGWRRGESVFVLSDDESVRIDVAARQTTQ